MAKVVGSGASTPTSTESLFRLVPFAPDTITLAEFGFSIVEPADRVLFTGTVEYTMVEAAPQVLQLQIIDQQTATPVFTTSVLVDTPTVTPRVLGFSQALLDGLPIGLHSYSLVATLTSGLLAGTAVTGPINFSAIALSDLG